MRDIALQSVTTVCSREDAGNEIWMLVQSVTLRLNLGRACSAFPNEVLRCIALPIYIELKMGGEALGRRKNFTLSKKLPHAALKVDKKSSKRSSLVPYSHKSFVSNVRY